MARGHPDYNAADISFFSIDDPNKNAIAIESGFNRLDNRGRIIWFDDFRQGLYRWNVQNNGTGFDPAHIMDEELSIGYHGSIKLDCIANSGISVMDSTLVLPVSKKLGVEVGLRLISNFGDMEINFSHNYSGTNAKDAIFYITSGTGKVEVYDNLTRRTVFTPATVGQITANWISIKFVIDAENNKWERCMIGNQQFDLSSYALRNGVTCLQGFTEIVLRNTGTSVTLKEEWYCGYVIISGDEP